MKINKFANGAFILGIIIIFLMILSNLLPSGFLKEFLLSGSFSIAESILMLVTIILIWVNYHLQKVELEKTSNALANQERLMFSQFRQMQYDRLQNVSFKLLELYQKALKETKFTVPNFEAKRLGTDGLSERLRNKYYYLLKDYTALNLKESATKFINDFKNDDEYRIYKNLVYKFLAIHKTLVELKYKEEAKNNFLEPLRFALNNQLTPTEFCIIKSVAVIEEDVEDMIEILKQNHITCTAESAFVELTRIVT